MWRLTENFIAFKMELLRFQNKNRVPLGANLCHATKVLHDIHNSLYYIHFEITGYPCNVIGSQRCDLFPNRTIFCSKSHLFLTQEEWDSKRKQTI